MPASSIRQRNHLRAPGVVWENNFVLINAFLLNDPLNRLERLNMRILTGYLSNLAAGKPQPLKSKSSGSGYLDFSMRRLLML